MQQPIGGASGDTLRTPMLLLRNSLDQLIRTDHSTSVWVEVASGEDGTLIGDLERTAEGGMVRFPLRFIGRVDQEYTLRFSAAGISVESHPFRVSAGAPTAEHSFVGIEQATAGEPTRITITLRDVTGNPVPGAGDQLHLAIVEGPHAELAFTPLLDLGDGRYRTSYTPRIARTDRLSISLGGSELVGSPFAIRVRPALPAPEKTEVSLPPGEAGMPTPVEIILHDAHGNRVAGHAESLSLEITSGANAASALEPIIEPDSGRYLSGYIPLRTGVDTVAIHLTGVSIGPPGGEVFSSAVHPGSPHQLTLAIAPSPVLPSGERLAPAPVVQFRDSLGNAAPEAGREVCLALVSGDGRLEGRSCVPSDSSGTAHFDGLTLSGRTGPARLAFSADGVLPVQHTIEVQTGSPDPAASSVILVPAMVDRQTSITISLFDSGGNPVSGTADRLTVGLAGSNAGTVLAPVREVESGRYIASYDPGRSGRDEVTVRIDGAEVRGSPFPLEIAEALRITSEVLPPWSAGAPGFTAVLTAEGGRAPYHWALASGSAPLPDDLTLMAEGVLSGAPETGGPYTVEVEVTDQDGFATTAAVRGILNPAPQQSGPPLLPAAEKGIAYSTTLGWSGGTAPVRWSVVRGELPPAIALDPARGELFGVPMTMGSYTFEIELRDAAGSTVSREFSIQIAPGEEDFAGPPTALSIDAGEGALDLRWQPPAQTGSTPITDYRIELSTDGGRSWIEYPADGSAELSRRIGGLQNQWIHRVRVAAVNLAGPGPFSAPVRAIPSAPVTEIDGTPLRPELGEAVVMIGGIPSALTRRIVQDTILELADPARSFALSLISIGVDGRAVPLSPAGTIHLRPAGTLRFFGEGYAPESVLALWLFSTPQFLGRAEIAPSGSVDGQVRIPPDLALGRHTLQANGWSPGQELSFALGILVDLPPPPPPPTFPDVPLEVRAEAGDGRVELTWSPPPHDGGSPIIEYQIEFSSDGGVSWQADPAPPSSVPTRRIEGLINRVGYSFRVRAVNLIGVGAFSEPTAEVIPRSDRPELEIEMRSDSDPVILGDTITLVVVVRNQGGRSAEEVVVTVDPAAESSAIDTPLPQRLRLLNAELTQGVFDPVNRSWQVGPLGSGGSARAEIRAEVLDPTKEEEEVR